MRLSVYEVVYYTWLILRLWPMLPDTGWCKTIAKQLILCVLKQGPWLWKPIGNLEWWWLTLEEASWWTVHAGTTPSTDLIPFFRWGWYMSGGDTKLSELYGNSKMQNLSLIFGLFQFHPSRIWWRHRCYDVIGALCEHYYCFGKTY